MPRSLPKPPDYRRYGAAVRLARVQILMLRQEDCADRIGVTAFTWRKIEKGDRVSSTMLYRAGSIMGWSPDDVEHILAGGKAPEIQLSMVADGGDNRIALLERQMSDLSSQVATLAARIEELAPRLNRTAD